MIQRIQTLFLLLAAGCPIGTIFFPLATADPPKADTIFSDRVFEVSDYPPLLYLLLFCSLIALVAIFLFKNRKLQLRFSGAYIFFVLLIVALAIYVLSSDSGWSGVIPGLGLLFLIVGIVFAIVASRSIRKDEALVRSMDRLR